MRIIVLLSKVGCGDEIIHVDKMLSTVANTQDCINISYYYYHYHYYKFRVPKMIWKCFIRYKELF